MEQKWLYSFYVWPDETASWSKEIFDLFKCLSTRVELEFTEWEFNAFRVRLGSQDIMLREIERIPSHKPESIL